MGGLGKGLPLHCPLPEPPPPCLPFHCRCLPACVPCHLHPRRHTCLPAATTCPPAPPSASYEVRLMECVLLSVSYEMCLMERKIQYFTFSLVKFRQHHQTCYFSVLHMEAGFSNTSSEFLAPMVIKTDFALSLDAFKYTFAPRYTARYLCKTNAYI